MDTPIEVKDEIIMRCYKGLVTLDDVIKSWDEVFSKFENLTIYKGFVSDMLDVDLRFKEKDLNRLADYLTGHIDRIKDMKLAVVMDTPLVIHPILMNHLLKKLQIRPFTTMDAAIKWISL